MSDETTPTPDALPEHPKIHVRWLGPPAWRRAEAGEGGASAWQLLTRKDAALLSRLALEGRQPRTRVAQWLWPEVALPRAHANLRQRLYRLRQLAGVLVDEADDGLQLAPGVVCDVWREGCCDAADFGAVLLAGLADEDDLVQAWLDDARRQWLARRADLMAGHAARLEAAGALAAALALTERLLALEPLLEHAWRRLMQLHSRRGDRAAAIAAFERCEQVLRDELGVRPSPETQALLHRIETLAEAPEPAPADGQPVLPPALLRPPRLSGRAAELQAMRAAWQAGTAFVLVGEAGLGKSRLMLEWAAAGPARVIETARPGDEHVPYAALVRLLRAMARLAPRPDALWPAADAAEERRELARLLPELGTPPVAPGLEALLHGAVELVFRCAPAAGLQAVLFDDLQYADAATRSVLQRAATLPGLHWGFATRPEPPAELAAWLASSARLLPVRLQPLGDSAIGELLAACALPGLEPAALAPALARHCGGNPLFALETLRHLVREGLPAAGDALPFPASVEAALGQRLAALSAPAQALAQVVAVAGADFDAEVAADVLEQPLLALAPPWGELEAAQVLRDRGFAHDVLREATLRALPQPLRRPLHARIARSLRARGAPAQRVAAHFDAAGQPGEAAAMSMLAAADARRLGRLAERLDHLRDAARGFEAVGDADGALDARVEQISARFALEGPQAAQALADELLPQTAGSEQRVALQLIRAGLALSRFDAAGVRAAAASARVEAESGSEAELSARLLDAAGQALAGDPAAAVAAVEPLRGGLPDMRDALQATNLWGYLAMVYALAGRNDDCIYALQWQRRLAHETGKADDEAVALTSLVGQVAMRGQAERAVADGQRALALQRRLGSAHGMVGALLALALAQIGVHALRDALATLAEARQAMAAASSVPDLFAIADEAEAEVWLRAGRPAQALSVWRDDVEAALSATRRVTRRALQASALARLGRHAEAQSHWQALLDAKPGPVAVLRAQLLAAQAMGDAAAARLPALLAAAAAHPAPLQALAQWARGCAAERSGDHAEALAAARALRELLPRARHHLVPEAVLRGWLCGLLDRVGEASEAAAERTRAGQWVREVVLPGLPDGCADDWWADPAHGALVTAGAAVYPASPSPV